MYMDTYYILVFFTVVCFLASLAVKDLFYKEILTLLCIPLFMGCAVYSLHLTTLHHYVVGSNLIEHNDEISFIPGAYMFGSFALISLVLAYKYYLEEKAYDV